VAKLRDAWEKKVALTFSTDFDTGMIVMKDEKRRWQRVVQMTIAFLTPWKAANIPARDILYAITING